MMEILNFHIFVQKNNIAFNQMVAPLNVYQEKMLEITYAKDIIPILGVSVHGKNSNSRLMIPGFQAVLFVMVGVLLYSYRVAHTNRI